MQLELTNRWNEQHAEKCIRTVTVGDIIEYYGWNNHNVDNPSEGIIKEDDIGFYIEWEDSVSDTRLDGSERSNDILKNCVWY